MTEFKSNFELNDQDAVSQEEKKDIKRLEKQPKTENEQLTKENDELLKALEEERDFTKVRNWVLGFFFLYITLLNIIGLALFLMSFYCDAFKNIGEYGRLALTISPISATVLIGIFIIKGVFSDRKDKLGKSGVSAGPYAMSVE